MAINYTILKGHPRLLLEAKLKPLQGDRFQPTGFADLGAARYTLPNGTEMLLVESTQSVANRLELACLDTVNEELIAELKGLPYIQVKKTGNNGNLTNSILEAHRINSEYVMKDAQCVNGERKMFREVFTEAIGYQKDKPVDWKKFHTQLFRYDPNSLIHGCFLEEIGGRLRATRALSGFIEARGVAVVESGGVKNNIVQPELKGGEGNVPYHRTEFVANEIKAYFNLDLALLHGYGLDDNATKLLIALSLFKIQRFLSKGLRLRTACDLELDGDLTVTRPNCFTVPEEMQLLDECEQLIAACKSSFADPAITSVEWREKVKPATVALPTNVTDPTISDDLKDELEWVRAKGNKGPKLKFKKALTTEIAEKAKGLWPDNSDVAKAIDDELKKQNGDSGQDVEANAQEDED